MHVFLIPILLFGGICLFTGIHLVLMGCNRSVTHFCPRYTFFDGTLYQIEYQCTFACRQEPPTQTLANWTTTPRRRLTYTDDDAIRCSCTVIHRAQSMDKSHTCRKYKRTDRPSKLHVGQPVSWYASRFDPTTCVSLNDVEDPWYAGIVFLFIATTMGLIVVAIHYGPPFRRSGYTPIPDSCV